MRSFMSGKPASRRRAQGGFSLMEMLVSLAILTVLMIGVLQLFESSTQVASTQLEQADVQQGVRVALEDVVRHTRLLGRGGLLAARDRAASGESWNDVWCPDGNCDDSKGIGLALRLDDNVPVDYHVVKGDNASPTVEPGTDVLTVRGVFNSPVYLVRYADEGTFTLNSGGTDADGNPIWTDGQVIVAPQTPIGEVDQDLSFLQEILAAGRPEAVLLVSPFSDEVFGIGKFDVGTSSMNADGTFTIGFSLDTSDPHAAAYENASANGVFPGDVLSQSRVGSVGILEEYRYYVRTGAQTGFEGVAGIEERKRLSRTRTYPGLEGTNAHYPSSASPTHVDLADDVLDFQVAFGFDGNDDGLYDETSDGAGDEWLGNNTGDAVPAAIDWIKQLGVARLSVFARSRTPHRGHQSPQILRLEDRDHSAGDPTDPADINSYESRLYLRFTLQSIVEMRNL